MKNDQDWPERRHRHDVELLAEVHYPDGHTSGASVSNLSLDGCRLTGWFRIGDYLELTLPRIGRVRGQVRWAVGGEAGIRFVRPDNADGAEA
ncbi:PilZ domain-containing protein [Sphingomonas kaistensis]|uniref:PilZ domain-containing protein n=1 Tax=Sphingomonas kaistensis TaxID=298708 RepID=A0ABZ2FXA8_9SPHN